MAQCSRKSCAAPSWTTIFFVPLNKLVLFELLKYIVSLSFTHYFMFIYYLHDTFFIQGFNRAAYNSIYRSNIDMSSRMNFMLLDFRVWCFAKSKKGRRMAVGWFLACGWAKWNHLLPVSHTILLQIFVFHLSPDKLHNLSFRILS